MLPDCGILWPESENISYENSGITFVLAVRPCVRMYQRGFRWTELREIWCWGLVFKRTVEKMEIWLKLCKNIGHSAVKTLVRFIIADVIK